MSDKCQKKVFKKDLPAFEERVSSVASLLLKRLELDLNLVVSPMSQYEYTKKYPHARLTMVRTARGLEDKPTFSLQFNPSIFKNEPPTQAELKKDIFHEILHALTWAFIDEQDAIIEHIKSNPALKKELKKRTHQVREGVVYILERKLGKFILHECDWTKDS
jgi:hypothetical protein